MQGQAMTDGMHADNSTQELDRLRRELADANARISQLEQTSHSLRSSEERHRVLADTMLQGVVHQDASGNIISMNPAAERILGKPRERFLGSSSVREERDTIREDGSCFPGNEHPSMVALRTGRTIRGVVMGVWNPSRQERRWIRIDAVPVMRPGIPDPVEVYTVFEDITAQRIIEAELRSSQARLALGMQVAGLALAEFDYATDTVCLSAEAASLYGIGSEACVLPRARLHDRLHPEDREAVTLQVAQSHDPAGAGWFDMEHRIVLSNGDVRWLRVRKQITFDGVGHERRPVHGLLAAFDITHEKSAAERVRLSGEFVRGVLDSLPEHVVVLDDEGTVREVNAPWLEFARSGGGERQAVDIGANYLDVCRRSAAAGDRYAAMALAGLVDVLSGKRHEFVFEYPCPSPTSHRWFLMHAQRMQYAGAGVILSHVDITDRKRGEHELAEIHHRLSESHALLDTLAAKAPVGLGFVDREFKFVRVNENLASIHRLTPQEHLGRTVAEVAPLFWSKHEHFYRIALCGTPVMNVELSDQAPGSKEPLDSTRYWLNSFYPVTVDNQTIGVGLVVVEVTAQKRTEQALKDADRHKDEFLATLAHELRNPLAPIRATVEALKLKKLDDPALELSRDVIDRQVTQMARLLEDLLDVSRISRNAMELRLERVELRDVLHLALETSRPIIDALEHRLTITMPQSPVTLHADAVRLAQVFSNLLNNSAKYTERGGRIELTATVEDGEAIVSVSDNGIGIAPEMQPRVFDIFTQATTALQRSQGGLGIGLSLVKGLVEMHGATICVQSDGHNQGSVFTVRLPLASADLPALLQKQPRSDLKASKQSCRILVADDMRDNADTLGIVLKVLGNEVHLAYGGEEACHRAEEFRPHVALLDIGMPKVNGYDVAKYIRQQPWGSDVMLVALTGWAREEDRHRTREAGFDHHLVKPVASSTLIDLISQLRNRQVEPT